MLTVLICISGGLLLLIAVLLLAIIVRRVRYEHYQRRYEARARVWEPLFFAYLEGEKTETSIAATLKKSEDYDAFVKFITFYLKSITGEELHALTDLAFQTGVVERLHEDLRGGRGKKRRAVAAITLGLMEDKDVLPHLRLMLDDSDPYLVYAGAYGIACLREFGLFMLVMRTLLAKTPITYEGASELLVRFGEGICPILTGILRDALIRHEREDGNFSQEAIPMESLHVRLEDFIEVSILVDIIGNFIYTEAGDLLLQVMEASDEDEVAIHVLKALVRLKIPGAASRIVPLLAHPNWVIRSQAVRALGALREGKYQREIETCLNDDQWWVRHYAAQTLQALA